MGAKGLSIGKMKKLCRNRFLFRQSYYLLWCFIKPQSIHPTAYDEQLQALIA
jgi:hypothetical protein